MLRPLAVAFTISLLADVVPHCGGPEVVIQAPGEDCGHHGPRWRGDCQAPAACFQATTHGNICTTTCVQDADCAPLGPAFTCSASGVPDMNHESQPPQKLCARAAQP